jgi:hypothetical protein
LEVFWGVSTPHWFLPNPPTLKISKKTGTRGCIDSEIIKEPELHTKNIN